MTTETELHTLPIDAHLIAIDETRHYSIPEADALHRADSRYLPFRPQRAYLLLRNDAKPFPDPHL